MKQSWLLAICLLLVTACSTIYRIDTAHLPADEVATLSIPLSIVIGKVDGQEVSGPLCTGSLCSKGIEISLAPGEHTVEVKFATAYIMAKDFTPMRIKCAKGGRYKLVFEPYQGSVKYRIEKL